jgi:hypothetical protein
MHEYAHGQRPLFGYRVGRNSKLSGGALGEASALMLWSAGGERLWHRRRVLPAAVDRAECRPRSGRRDVRAGRHSAGRADRPARRLVIGDGSGVPEIPTKARLTSPDRPAELVPVI